MVRQSIGTVIRSTPVHFSHGLTFDDQCESRAASGSLKEFENKPAWRSEIFGMNQEKM